MSSSSKLFSPSAATVLQNFEEPIQQQDNEDDDCNVSEQPGGGIGGGDVIDFLSSSSLNLADSVELQIASHFVPLMEQLQNEIIESRSKICTIIEGYESKISKLQSNSSNTNTNTANTTPPTIDNDGGLYASVKKSMELHQEQLNRSRLEKEKLQLSNQLKEMEKSIEKLQTTNAQQLRNFKNIEKEKALLEKQIQTLEKTVYQNNEKYQQLLVSSRKEKEKLLAENREEIKIIENNHHEDVKSLKQTIKREQEKTSNFKSKFEDSEKQISFLQHEYKQKFQMLEMENRRLQSEIKSLKQSSHISSSGGGQSENDSKSTPSFSRNNSSSNFNLESPRYYGRYSSNLYY